MIDDRTGVRRRPDWGHLFRRVNPHKIWESAFGDTMFLRHRYELYSLLECDGIWSGEMYALLERI
jgi:hypothetical protein